MKLVCKMIQLNADYLATLAGLLVTVLGYLLSASLTNAVLFGIPNGLLLSMFGFHFWEVIGYQLVYIHFVCKYLKLKTDELNGRLSKLSDRQLINTFRAIEAILKSFDSLHKEINEYNETFFSKLYLMFWLTFGSATVFYLYVLIFNDMLLYVRIYLIYFLSIFMAIFLFVIFTASSVNSTAFESYIHLNRLFVFTTKVQNSNSFRVHTKIKGIFNVVLIIFNYLLVFICSLCLQLKGWVKGGLASTVGNFSQLIISSAMRFVWKKVARSILFIAVNVILFPRSLLL